MNYEKRCEWCYHCLYVGDGGFWCDEKEELIADDWDFSETRACPKHEGELMARDMGWLQFLGQSGLHMDGGA